MATKHVLAMSLIAFWMFLPVPLMLVGIGGFNEITTEELQGAEAPTFIGAIVDMGNFLFVYFKVLFFVIPQANFIIARFINFLQLMSALFIVVMLRGN